MRKIIWRVVLLLCCLLVGAAALFLHSIMGFHTRLTKEGAGIVAHPPPSRGARGKMASLPRFDPASLDPNQIDLQGRDLRELDLRQRLPDLLQASFDSHTQWPAALPTGFDPNRSLELGKNPGLGVRTLHAKGITGRGVSVAIIDHRLLVDHVEYAGRLRLYEELHSTDPQASMHGTAVASIAVGTTVGVAPEADLYYISDYLVKSLYWVKALTSSATRAIVSRLSGRRNPSSATGRRLADMVDHTWTAKGIRRVLDINRRLPRDRKIRVISVEIGWTPGEKGYEEVTAALQQAKKEGVFVISSSLRDTHRVRFHGLGRDPLSNPDNPASYHLITGLGG